MRQRAACVTLLLASAHAGLFPKLSPARSPSPSDFDDYFGDSLPEDGISSRSSDNLRLARRIGLGMAGAFLIEFVMETLASLKGAAPPAMVEDFFDDDANATDASAEELLTRYDYATHGAVDQAFLDACDGDVEIAEARWLATCEWRQAEGINASLEEPQPHFHAIKAHYPHFYHKVGVRFLLR
jgi:hypothetical protein